MPRRAPLLVHVSSRVHISTRVKHSSIFLRIAKLKCSLSFLVYISSEPEVLQKGMTYQTISTETKDSVSLIIIGIDQRVKDKYQI